MQTAPTGFITLTKNWDNNEPLVVLIDAIMTYEWFSNKRVTTLTLKSGHRHWVKETPVEITDLLIQKEQPLV